MRLMKDGDSFVRVTKLRGLNLVKMVLLVQSTII